MTLTNSLRQSKESNGSQVARCQFKTEHS